MPISLPTNFPRDPEEAASEILRVQKIYNNDESSFPTGPPFDKVAMDSSNKCTSIQNALQSSNVKPEFFQEAEEYKKYWDDLVEAISKRLDKTSSDESREILTTALSDAREVQARWAKLKADLNVFKNAQVATPKGSAPPVKVGAPPPPPPGPRQSKPPPPPALPSQVRPSINNKKDDKDGSYFIAANLKAELQKFQKGINGRLSRIGTLVFTQVDAAAVARIIINQCDRVTKASPNERSIEAQTLGKLLEQYETANMSPYLKKMCSENAKRINEQNRTSLEKEKKHTLQ